MAVSRKIALKTNEQSGNQLHIYEVNPIIFYSGEADELNIELLEFNYGELIIKSLSTAILKVKELIMENEEFTVKWKQSARVLYCFSIGSPNRSASFCPTQKVVQQRHD
jgi:hypothetical protein